jgi:adenylyl- and sulfurtransferase ThiI
LQHSDNAKVKIKDPDITVQVEIKDKKMHIIKNRVE